MKTSTKPKAKVITDSALIDNLLTRTVENVLPSPEFLKKRLMSGERLKIYQGFDPTGDTLHIGHTVGMRKLRDFQKLGHEVIFLIGDFTGRIGDPSDKGATRVMLTKEQVEENMKGYIEQASRIVDFKSKTNPAQIKYNASWLAKLNFEDIVKLASVFTVQQMLKRDMFQKRLENDKPIYIHEFMYPLMQAYDSYTMDIDVEVGGNDQTFNMLCGRDLELKWLNKEKAVLATKLLTDPTGKKMGKSEGNMIMLSDSANDMYGKVMAFPDSLITLAFELLTDIPMSDIKAIEQDIVDLSLNPMEAKKRLALTVTSEFKGAEEAKKAQAYFEKVIQGKGEAQVEIPEIKVPEKKIRLIDLISEHAKITESNSQAKRLIEQGAVYINGEKVTDKENTIDLSNGEVTLKAGKKSYRISAK